MNDSVAIKRRSIVKLAIALPLAGLGHASAQAGRTITLVVPVPPGGGMDASARLIAEHVRDTLGTIIIENRPGAALRLGIEAVKRAEPNGGTLLFGPGSPFTIFPYTYKRLAYDVRTDFIPVAMVCSYDFALGVPGTSPIGTLADYVEAVRRDPGKSGAYAIPGAGSAPHFAGAQFARIAGIETKYVPYKGSAPAMNDLIGGHVPAAFNLLGEFLPFLAEKRVKVIATTGAKRSQFMPNVPTFTELGFKDMVLGEWFGIFAPARTPAATVERINAALAVALQKQEVIARFNALGYVPIHMGPAALSDRILAELRSWEPIVKSTGFTVEE